MAASAGSAVRGITGWGVRCDACWPVPLRAHDWVTVQANVSLGSEVCIVCGHSRVVPVEVRR